jgi:glycosyltransferase involved in cell wall biosynthesis
MQSQEFFGADSQIHASIMRHLDKGRFEVHCAVALRPDGSPTAASAAVANLAGVQVRPTAFGPSLEGLTRSALARQAALTGAPTLWSLVGLVGYVRRNRIQIIHCTEKPRDAFYGTLVARAARAQCVVHVHVKAESWIRSMVRRSMHRAAGLIGVSEFVADSIRNLGYDESKVFTVLNGLEVDEWVGADADGGSVRREFGISPGTPLLASVSRLFRYKGQHELLEALAVVRDHVPDVKLLIVGEDDPRGYREGPSYTAELKQICDRLTLNNNVMFTGFRTDVRSIMAACDVYAMPSFEEPFGMVFTEAMALGKPVVALDNGGTPEVVEHGRTGLLSPPGDTEGLATNLLRLLSDRALRHRMGEEGRRRVLGQLNAERMTRDVERVYGSVLAGRRG